ncbi:hypothetical protein HAZT_HAZT007675 [Hyalella azteca]|uniref:BBS7 beta-propeller domain-containing protein n=1 Tax=Hyalella azteca TaxID=294128 RepID=A0A6A0GTE8_HYAAZ|nr:hypothetical protein HAZT_HAZT007675 [Hyalella azteca]
MNDEVAVGDCDGLLQLFSMKRGALQLAFKTVPGKSITRLELGGALNTPKDKIFVSAGNEVRGYTKKGKQFLGFDTNLAEDIKSILELPGTPSALHLFYGDAGETGDLVLYGTTDGRLGLIQLGRSAASHRWVCDTSSLGSGPGGGAAATTTAGGITCMDHHDMTGS